jgi:hypothetical protein
LAKFTGQSVPEVQETANPQVLSLQKSLFSSAAFWQRLAGQGEGQAPGKYKLVVETLETTSNQSVTVQTDLRFQ